MELIEEYDCFTLGHKPCDVQIWRNHHGGYECHVFVREDATIFSSYDQEDRDTAVRRAFERAHQAGY